MLSKDTNINIAKNMVEVLHTLTLLDVLCGKCMLLYVDYQCTKLK